MPDRIEDCVLTKMSYLVDKPVVRIGLAVVAIVGEKRSDGV